MNILVISQYYHPEPTASSNRLSAFVDAMIDKGHHVTVICEFPNHPYGVLNPKDKWKLFRVEDHGTHKIIRTFVITFKKKNNIKRLIFYLSFALSSFIASLLIKRRDLVFSSSPPIFHVFTSLVSAKIKRSKFVADIRDLWPDSVLYFKAMSDSKFLKMGAYLERFLYKKSDLITTTTQGFKKAIEKRGGAGKAILAYNGSEKDIMEWTGDFNSVRSKEGWNGKVAVCYAGLIGLGQNVAAIIPELENMDNNGANFIFIGGGPGQDELKALVKKYKLQNVEIKDHMSRSEIIEYIHASDIMMVILREGKYFNDVIPSKFFDYLAAGKPVVTNADGETREIMEKYETGLYFSLKEKGSFAKVVNRLINDPDLRLKMGQNGRNLIKERFLRSKIALDTLAELEEFRK